MYSHEWFEEIGTSYATAYSYLSCLEPHNEVDYQYLINLFKKGRKTVMSKLAPKSQQPEIRRKSDNFNKYCPEVPIVNTRVSPENLKSPSREE